MQTDRLVCDPDMVRRTLEIFLAPDQVTEVRVLDHFTNSNYKSTLCGYYNDPELILRDVCQLRNYSGIYFVMNPADPALRARCADRLAVPSRGLATGDSDILCRRWLLVDADPARPAGVSSTDEEHSRSIDRAKSIRETLALLGWPEPILADSGNGCHLLYPVDLPADDGGLLENVLKGLAAVFDDKEVKVDQRVFNPSRITKLYGTPVHKGDNLAGQPHRLSKLLKVPLSRRTVSPELLEDWANEHAPKEKAGASHSGPNGSQRPNGGGAGFDIEAFIARHGLAVKGPQPYKDGRIWTFPVCPWNSDHTNESAWIIQMTSGALSAGCHHNGCSGMDWHALRDLYEPRSQRATFSPPPGPNGSGSADSPGDPSEVRFKPEIYTAEDLQTMEFPPLEWVVPEILPKGGGALFAGKFKIGKSWLVYQLSIAVATGGRALGYIEVDPGEVLYLALEDQKRRMQDRMKGLMEGGAKWPARLHLTHAWARFGDGGEDALEEWLGEHPDCRLVVVDTFVKARSARTRFGNDYEQDYAAMDRFKQIGDAHGATVLVTHHMRKLDAEDPFDRINGTSGLGAAADTIWAITGKRGEADAYLHLTGRDLEAGERPLEFNPGDGFWKLLEGNGEDHRVSKERKALLDVLRQAGTPMSPSDLAAALGCEIRVTSSLLYKMVVAGEVVKTGRAAYTLPEGVSDQNRSTRSTSENSTREAEKSTRDESTTGSTTAPNDRSTSGAGRSPSENPADLAPMGARDPARTTSTTEKIPPSVMTPETPRPEASQRVERTTATAEVLRQSEQRSTSRSTSFTREPEASTRGNSASTTSTTISFANFTPEEIAVHTKLRETRQPMPVDALAYQLRIAAIEIRMALDSLYDKGLVVNTSGRYAAVGSLETYKEGE